LHLRVRAARDAAVSLSIFLFNDIMVNRSRRWRRGGACRDAAGDAGANAAKHARQQRDAFSRLVAYKIIGVCIYSIFI